MKVLDLRCPQDHRFEGWFASDDDYAAQRERGLVACPLCGKAEVERMPSAPRLNLSGNAAAPAAASAPQPVMRPDTAQALWLQAVRHVLASTEDVGGRFAEEARRIHYGESPNRGIRGQATPEQSAELADEGIEVMPLPLPAALKEPLQ